MTTMHSSEREPARERERERERKENNRDKRQILVISLTAYFLSLLLIICHSSIFNSCIKNKRTINDNLGIWSFFSAHWLVYLLTGSYIDWSRAQQQVFRSEREKMTISTLWTDEWVRNHFNTTNKRCRIRCDVELCLCCLSFLLSFSSTLFFFPPSPSSSFSFSITRWIRLTNVINQCKYILLEWASSLWPRILQSV
jgi:hypothetical protein